MNNYTSKTDYDDDFKYLREHLEAADLVPYPWEGEDKNLGAFRSKEELVAWYCQRPGIVAQPYRDRAFYPRELAHVSRLVRPWVVVEFGTSHGIGTCLLHWLNPSARLVTVDVNTETFLPGDQRVPMGHLAKYQRIPCQYIPMASWDYVSYDGEGVGLCFIDAEHTYEAVRKDSNRAWLNRAWHWAIVWHDHNDRHPGVMAAVAEFCDKVMQPLQSRPDSDTVWITNC